MNKLIFSSLIIIILTVSSTAQDTLSIQLNGGFINPVDSKKGLTGSVQLNYQINSKFNFYIYSGYSGWSRNKIIFQEDIVGPQTQQNFNSYSTDDHNLIPVYIGGKINLHKNKIFTSFVNFEVGYSHLSYKEYLAWEKVYAESGEVTNYKVNTDASIEVNENLFGVGFGAGVFRNIGSNINLILSFKLNSFLNSKYNGLFTGKGTYTMFLAGFNFTI